jgi:hypothetical protein
MAHYAKVENGIVTTVIVADAAFIASGAVGDPAQWVQTSYNTRGGVHYGPDGQPSGLPGLGKNFAGIGYAYDAGREAFIPPAPYASWVLNETTCWFEAPVPMPDDGKAYAWNEETQGWEEVAAAP